MSKEIWEISATAAQNQFPPADGGWIEGMSRSDVNDASRENLSTLRRWYNDPEWIRPRIQGPFASNIGVFARIGANTVTITLSGVDLSGYFTDGRIIKILDGAGAGSDLVTQCDGDAVYGSGVTTITTKAAVDVAATDIYTHSSSIIRAQALLDDNTQFYIPATADSAGIQAAIDAASAAGGGIVFLNQNSYSIATQIDVTGTKGNVHILGKSPQVTLLRTAAIGSIINFSNASKSLRIENVKFDIDWTSNPTGNGYGLSIGACLSIDVARCEFSRANVAVKITGSVCKRMSFEACAFTYHKGGIETNAVGDVHEGIIRGCVFDGSLISIANPVGVKLSGTWEVNGNLFKTNNHASLAPVACHIWDKTAPGNGGYRSVVVGNTFAVSGAGATGTSIWMGADDTVCVGNVVAAPASGIGIKLGGQTASIYAERILCNSNAVWQGATGIQVTEFCRHGMVAYNSIRPNSGTCIVLAGDLMDVSHNQMRVASIGIDILASASLCNVRGNTAIDVTSDAVIVRSGASDNSVFQNFVANAPVRGINVEATALNTSVFDNHLPAVATPVTNASSSTRFGRNNQKRRQVSFFDDTNTIAFGGTRTAAFSGDLPDGGGIGEYDIIVGIDVAASAINGCVVQFHAGPLGTVSDPVVATIDSVSPGVQLMGLWENFSFILTSALDTKLTCSVGTSSGSGGNMRLGFIVFKADEPLG